MTLGPPPLASRRFAAAASFQEVSGMYESADPRLALLDALQYVPVPSLKDVPPTPVTSGMLAGSEAAVPWTAVAAVLDSQPKAPESPDDAIHVMPCALACSAIRRSTAAVDKAPVSQVP